MPVASDRLKRFPIYPDSEVTRKLPQELQEYLRDVADYLEDVEKRLVVLEP